MWVSWQEFIRVVHVLHLMELSSSWLLHYIVSPENLNCGCCVATPKGFLIRNVHNHPNMIQRLLHTLSFIFNKPNQPKHHNWVLSLLKRWHVSSSLLHYITIHISWTSLFLSCSNLSFCLSTALYLDTVDCYSLYHALLNALLCLIQVSLHNSPFSLKSACYKL